MGQERIENPKKKVGKSSSKSSNLYLNMIIKIYRFLARRSYSNFNKTILKRLFMSRLHKASISLSRLNKIALKNPEKTIIVVGKILNDERKILIQPMKICALSFSETAKKRILQSNGKIFNFGNFALNYPTGKNSVLIRGVLKKRKNGN
jgi:large subunit ribosomal protein L18e